MQTLRRLIVWIDKFLFRGALQELYRSNFVPKKWSATLQTLSEWNSIEIAYTNNSRPKLNEIFARFNTDKGSLNPRRNDHAYADFYDSIFFLSRHTLRNVLEIGIGSNNADVKGFMGVDATPGASLRVWREYFPNARIYGADIDSRILFEEDRIKTFYVDQTDKNSVLSLWENINIEGSTEFELIVDDGLHTFEAATTLLRNSLNKLSLGGVYAIEDLEFHDIVKIEEIVDPKKYHTQYIKFTSKERGLITGSLVAIRRFL